MTLAIKLFICLALALVPALSRADGGTVAVAPGADLQHQARKGWFFYRGPAPKPKTPVVPIPEVPAKPGQLPQLRCLVEKTWSADCGFVDPGKSFSFQAKERDALLKNMVMSPENPKAVEAFQRYTKWMVGKALAVANMWYWNMTQHPDLDPSVKQPISTFGLDLATKIDMANSNSIFKLLKKDGAILFYFSKSNCEFCHDMVPGVFRIVRDTGLPVYNAPLDDICLPGFAPGTTPPGMTVGAKNAPAAVGCMPAGTSLKPAEILQVTTVPALFLFIPHNTWIRVATGVVSDTTVESRMVNFFSAWRAAVVHGVVNGEGIHPSVDFNPSDNPAPTGVAAGVAASSGGGPVPTQAEIKKLLAQ